MNDSFKSLPWYREQSVAKALFQIRQDQKQKVLQQFPQKISNCVAP